MSNVKEQFATALIDLLPIQYNLPDLLSQIEASEYWPLFGTFPDQSMSYPTWHFAGYHVSQKGGPIYRYDERLGVSIANT